MLQTVEINCLKSLNNKILAYLQYAEGNASLAIKKQVEFISDTCCN